MLTNPPSQNATPQLSQPELLLPVGDLDMALAAIHNGADAIFMGVPGFNARGRSHDFTIEELKTIIETCHLYGVKVNLAFNILIFQNELTRAQALLEQILPLGPDAVIVQDLGLVRLIRQISPNQRVHASTQMTVTNHEAICFLEDLNIQRFVLGRENSLEEIRKIRSQTSAELEVFVHGALCVSYSGQCFTSESLGGRSANRGQCAQSCRFSYELLVDGEKKDLQGKSYLLSPQDLCGLADVPSLIEAGVNCFKVEGRLKTPEYVATAARSYRQAIHSYFSGKKNSSHEQASQFQKMSVAYSRGFFSGWLHGVAHQKLVPADSNSHRGFEFGKIHQIFEGKGQKCPPRIQVQLFSDLSGFALKPGDGILWTCPVTSENPKGEGGSFVYAVRSITIAGAPGLEIELDHQVQLSQSLVQQRIFLNHDRELEKSVHLTLKDRSHQKRIPVDVEVFLAVGNPLRVRIFDGQTTCEAETSSLLQVAQSRALTDVDIQEEMSALGGTAFLLRELKVQRDGNAATSLFLSHRDLKQVRQQVFQKLTESRRQSGLTLAQEAERLPLTKNLQLGVSKRTSEAPKGLHILLRDYGQVVDLVQSLKEKELEATNIALVTLDFEYGRNYSESIEVLRSQELLVGVATTRIHKPHEYRNLNAILNLKPDAILVRNLGALHYFNQQSHHPLLLGDFSLNVTNHLTSEYLLNRGLSSLCVSYDLSAEQINELVSQGDVNRTEITIYQYMPSFHMEHCVFAAFLSQGNSWRDCGKPCEQHEVLVKDQYGHLHQIKADVECRNTMYSSKAQSAARFVSQWQALGVQRFRYEALKERSSELIKKIKSHLDLISGQLSAQQLLSKMETLEFQGVTEGQLAHSKEFVSRKKIALNKQT